jgi:hypothetical protein
MIRVENKVANKGKVVNIMRLLHEIAENLSEN